MEHPVKKISLDYGDTQISFYEVDLKLVPSRTLYLHSHYCYELHFSTGNNFRCSFNDKIINLKPFEFVIIPPDLLHMTNKHQIPQEKIFPITMDIKKTKGAAQFYDTFSQALREHILKPIPFPRHLEETISLLTRKELYSHILGVLQLKAAAATFVSWLFSQMLTKSPVLKQESGNNMVLIDYMINSTDITLEQMAAATNYSKRHIARLIQQRYGCNLTELRRQKKIQKIPEEQQKRFSDNT